MHTRIATLALVILTASTGAQGVAWQQRSTAGGPPARSGPGLTYDAARNRVLMFGGTVRPGVVLDDTWEWDGSIWTPRFPVNRPPVASGIGNRVVYDNARQRCVLVAGNNSGLPLQTWEWDGTDWTRRQPPTSPSARYGFGLAYDEARQRTVLFGGYGAGRLLSDTWEWDGTLWTQRASGGPPARVEAAMTFDSTRRRVVLFGSIGPLSDTWEWDGTMWFEHFGIPAPLARDSTAAVYDATRGVTVVFGGATWGAQPQLLNDTWEWNGTAWEERTPFRRPPARSFCGMAFDSVRGRVVIFGGASSTSVYGDTWEYQGVANSQPAWAALGTGCTGTNGSPVLSPETGQLPYLGENFRMRIAPLPVSILVTPIGILGASDTQWGPLPLPFDLGVVGMIGCVSYVSLDIAVALTNQNGTATWPISIPYDLVLVGQGFYQQGLVVDPGSNAMGLIVSNGGAATMGLR